jgi:hypothetical protein
MFAEGLPKMLHYNIISLGGRHRPNSWQEWTEAAVEQQQKWLYLQTFFNGKAPQKKQGPNQNWCQGKDQVLQRIQMPWILPLDISVQGEHSQTKNMPN